MVESIKKLRIGLSAKKIDTSAFRNFRGFEKGGAMKKARFAEDQIGLTLKQSVPSLSEHQPST